MTTGTATRAPPEIESPARTAASPTATRTTEPGPDTPRLLDRIPKPAGRESVVSLDRLTAGGLTAVQAEWGVDGGTAELTGQAPFTSVRARAGFRSDGSLDGTVALDAEVGLFGLTVGRAQWQVGGWTPDLTLPMPAVTLRGATLAVDVAAIGADVAISVTEGLGSASSPDGTLRIDLPNGTITPGESLEPRVAELFAGLLGVDVSGLRVHRDAPVEQAPAFVTNPDLFFAPSRYGVDSPETAALLDAAIRAALRGFVGAVAPSPQAPPPAPASDAGTVPSASTDIVPATVPEQPAVSGEAVAAPGEEAGAAGGEAAGGAAVMGSGEAGAAVEGAAAAGGEAAAEGGEAAEAEVELIMPPAPTEVGPAAAGRMGGVAGGAGGAAKAAMALPPAETNVADARGAVTEPASETAARAKEALANELGERPAPSPEIVALCERIRTAILEQRPADEDELLKSDPTKAAKEAGGTITDSVDTQVGEVQGSYDGMDSPPAGTPALTPQPVTQPDPTSPGMGTPASVAAPDPIPPENLSLDADVKATDTKIAESGIDTDVTKEIPTDPFAGVRNARGELGGMAEQTPAQLAEQQAAAIAGAQADMANLQAKAVAALQASRGGTVTAVGGGQAAMVGSEQATRESVSANAQKIFDTAQKQVNDLLEPLTRTAMARWDAGLAKESQDFKDSLDRVDKWIEERHSGATGYVVAVGDAVFGLPDWVIREYDRAEKAFGDGICTLLLEISTEVNGVVAAAQALIKQARTDIDAAFREMEKQFPEWAAQEKAKFSGLLDGLSAKVTEAQTSFVKDVSKRALTAVAEVQRAAEERRNAARGVIGRIAKAIDEFLKDPARAIINGLLTVVGIPPGAFWALVDKIQQVISDIADDPIGFVNNLVAGIKQGFQQFFDNFGTHVLAGFWKWLFSGLEVPIPMPKDLSAGSLFSFALQLMGITWPRVRQILVKHVGEQNVAIIEAAWQLISMMIQLGPDGMVAMVKEKLAPEAVVQAILEAAVEYLIETLIKQVVVRVIGMLNPAGAVAQAIEAIYQVLAWVFRNAARIFAFVEAVVNGMADVVAGNIGGLASAVEKALAMLVPIVIDFLAGLLHLGGLPGKVAEVVNKLQAMVLAAIDAVIGFIVKQAKALMKALGLGGKDDKDKEGAEDEELGTTVRFAADGEGHKSWFQVAGPEATLMVASAPVTIESKIGEWKALLAQGKPPDEDKRKTAETKIPQLASEAGLADTEADALQQQFAAASTTPDAKAPSDDALESRQNTVAGLLAELFTLFGDDEGKWLADIAANLPTHGDARTKLVLENWVGSRIAKPEAAPLEGARGRVWNPADYTAANFVVSDVVNSPSIHTNLLGYFRQETAHEGADTAAFATYALVSRNPNPGHRVRVEFLASLGNRVAAKLREDGLKRLDGTGDSSLRDQVTSIQYSQFGGDYGSFLPWPGEDLSVLVHGLILNKGTMPTLQAFVSTGSANGVGYDDFRTELSRSPATRTWLSGQLRGVSTATHEWIPVSIGADVLDHAVTLSKTDLKKAMRWVSLLENLRSPTNGVMWQIVSDPVIVPGAPPPPAGQKIIAPAAHVATLSLDRFTLVQDGLTVGTGQFHDELRSFFAANKAMDPADWVDALLRRIESLMWTGSNVVIPKELLNKPIGVFYSMGDEFKPGLTVAQVMAEQQKRWQEIVAAFRSAKARL